MKIKEIQSFRCKYGMTLGVENPMCFLPDLFFGVPVKWGFLFPKNEMPVWIGIEQLNKRLIEIELRNNRKKVREFIGKKTCNVVF